MQLSNFQCLGDIYSLVFEYFHKKKESIIQPYLLYSWYLFEAKNSNKMKRVVYLTILLNIYIQLAPYLSYTGGGIVVVYKREGITTQWNFIIIFTQTVNLVKLDKINVTKGKPIYFPFCTFQQINIKIYNIIYIIFDY